MALHTKPMEKRIKEFLFPELKEETIIVQGLLGKREQQKSEQEDIFGDVEERKAIQ
jgi:hypothetical protein